MEALNPTVLYSAEAERAVLGCMLSQPYEVIDQAWPKLQAEDFFVPAHQEIFDAVIGMQANSVTIDTIAVHQWLTDRKLADAVGSPGILAELLVGFANHLNVGQYIRIVKEKALLRALQLACASIVADIADMPDSVASVLDRAETAICNVTTLHVTQQQLSARACAERFVEWRGKIQRGELQARVPTGFRQIDERNQGLPLPGFGILAGEQGVGKSAMIANFTRNFCSIGYGVGGFSLEMTTEDLLKRMVGDKLSMDTRRMNSTMPEEHDAAVIAAAEEIGTWNFTIDPTPGLTPHDLRAGVRRMVKAGCRVFWLDNAQITDGDEPRDTRRDQLAALSRTCQELSKEHNALFILLVQVTRSSQKERRHFIPSDLADCAQFERDARFILFIEKNWDHENPPVHSVPIWINIAKYSDGCTGVHEATFNKLYQRIQ